MPIVIKGADKGSGVVVWGRKDYIKEAENQLGDTKIYVEVPNDTKPPMNTILNTYIRKRGDFCTDTLNYFIIKDAKFARFYLLSEIHKKLHNVPGRPVISNCGYHTENISSFLDFYLQPIAKKVKSFIKDNNDVLKRLHSLTNLPDNSLLCAMDVVGLYTNILHDEGLPVLRKRLDERDEKDVSTDTLVELVELVLKNNIFNFNEKTLKQKRGIAIGAKFSPPYRILFMAELEEKILEKVDNKPYLWWRHIDDIFFIWEHVEQKLRNFVETLNKFHPTIKFIAEWSQKSIKFLDVTVSLIEVHIEAHLYAKPTDSPQYHCRPYHCKKSIPYSQALHLKRICSKNNFFHIHCNNLEKWLSERGYSEKLVRKETVKGRSK